jgi:hypothetical protein
MYTRGFTRDDEHSRGKVSFDGKNFRHMADDGERPAPRLKKRRRARR